MGHFSHINAGRTLSHLVETSYKVRCITSHKQLHTRIWKGKEVLLIKVKKNSFMHVNKVTLNRFGKSLERYKI